MLLITDTDSRHIPGDMSLVGSTVALWSSIGDVGSKVANEGYILLAKISG